MLVPVTRRDLIFGSLALPLLNAAGKADITVGITVDTRPDWNGSENFMRSVEEASSAGWHWVETFWPYVMRWETHPQGLKEVLDRLNLKLETVSNSGPMRTNFVDPNQREGVIQDHMKLIQFIHWFGCDHLKINCGSRPQDIAGRWPAYSKEMSITFNEIGKRTSDMGMKFGVHAHLGSAFQTRREIDSIMEQTDPKHVYLIVDTGHVTMAGMDPVELTRTYVSRIIEFHIKDAAPQDRGGHKGRLEEPYNTTANNRIFFELGKGGVDFPGIKKILDDHSWKGWWTVELDRTATTALESCKTSKAYLEKVMGLKV